MEISKKIITFSILFLLIFQMFAVDIYANTIPSDGIVSDFITSSDGTNYEYVKSITSQRTGMGAFDVQNQGYRISLLEETGTLGYDDHAECAAAIRCILDLVNSDSDPTWLTDLSCTASYGFQNNKRYDTSDMGDPTIRRLFNGPSEDDIVYCSDTNLVGMSDYICDGIDKIQGQSKLAYRHSYSFNYGIDGFHGSICYNRHIITKGKLKSAGYKIVNGDDFWFYSESGGMKTAQFYNKGENSSVRFFMALINLFEENWSGFDISNLSKYYFIFEPIIWFYNSKLDDYNIANANLRYSFYGTLTELAYIQMNSHNEEWGNRIGFVGIAGDDQRSVSGAWLYDMQVCSFVDGGAMMLRTSHRLSENEPVWIQNIASDFYNKYNPNYSSEISRRSGDFDSYCYGDYVVENMGIACLTYNPPLTYFAQDYEYRTNTEVVTSIKITNNSSADFLPKYESVYDYERFPNRDEPVAIGAILEYTNESGSPLSAQQIADLELPDFVSIQGVGASQNFDVQRMDGFETTPSNEAYLYFKWKTPSEPIKINVTARFVGDNDKNPIYINYAPGSAEGENLLYTGTNYAYQNKTFTTVTFSCDIKDTIEQLNENNVPPDPISGFMDKPSASASASEQEKYAENVSVYNNYDSSRTFNMEDYLTDPDNEEERVKRLNWFEYTAQTNPFDNTVRLTLHQYRADSWMRVQENIESWTIGGKNPIVVLDNVPQEIHTATDGQTYRFIPSGYGFTYAFEEDYQGRNDDGVFGFSVASEDEETIKNACTMFQNGIMLYPEFNYSSDYVSTIETCMYEWFDGDDSTYDSVHVLSHNINSLNPKTEIEDINDDNGGLDLLKSRVHFIPVWFPDNSAYKVEVLLFDYWTPAGQIYDHETYTFYIDGNIYDHWYATKSDINQKK